MSAIRRAIQDTFENRFLRSLFLVVCGAVISFLVVRRLLGEKEAMLELPYIYAGIAGAVGPLGLLFLWNLACAPFRIERDAHEETKRKLALAADSETAKLSQIGEGLSSVLGEWMDAEKAGDKPLNTGDRLRAQMLLCEEIGLATPNEKASVREKREYLRVISDMLKAGNLDLAKIEAEKIVSTPS